jgi:hypothetical protein
MQLTNDLILIHEIKPDMLIILDFSQAFDKDPVVQR